MRSPVQCRKIPMSITYNYSSGFEAVIGYLYLLGRTERVQEVLSMKQFDSLKNRKEEIRNDMTETRTNRRIIGGKNPIVEALRSGRELNKIWIAEGLNKKRIG